MKYQITIPKPCHEDWRKMTVTEKGKFCKSCSKEVVDFTNLSNSAITKIVSKNKNICGRFKNNQLNTALEVIQKNNVSKVAAGLALISTIAGSEPVFAQSKNEIVEVLNVSLEKVFVENDSIEKEVIIKGKVKDSLDVLPGANIVLKGTGIGTQTDFDGNFSIKIPNKKAKSTILVISYLGYETQEIDVLSIKKPLIIELKENNELLGEVVTVGMVAVKRPNIFKRIGNLFRKKENRRY